MPDSEGGLTAAEIAALYALIQAQARIREQLVRIAVTGALAPLRAVNWFDPADVAEAVERVLRVVQPAQLRMAQVTDATMARVLSTMLGRTVRPVGAVDILTLRRVTSVAVARRLAEVPPVEIEPDGELDDFFADFDAVEREREERALEELRRERERQRERSREDRERADRERERRDQARQNLIDRDRQGDVDREVLLQPLDPMEPYVRIGAQYRYEVSRGTSPGDALEEVLERVERVAEEDISLAQRAQESAAIRQSDPQRVTGYRRILQPELGSGGPPCGLCVVAADRVYKRDDLKPIHSRCRCAVLPITRGADPGLNINIEDLGRLYEAAGGTAGRKLKRLRVGIGENGEIGPILFPYGRGFRDAEEAESDRRVGSIERRLQGLERSTTALQRQLAAGETRLRPLVGYQQRLIDQLREQLAA